MKLEKILYAALALFALINAAQAETDPEHVLISSTSIGIIGQYQKAAKDGQISISPAIKKVIF